MTNWMQLAEHLAAIPDLPGARCKGQPDRFDLPEPYTAADPATESRLTAAAEVCTRCPALDRCGRWVDGLAPKLRPAGVVAGRVFIRRIGSTTTIERS
ncbi:hypothetical protein [Mycolicibacterium iranicum]|uniref:4Fe-4S Wbl-type domain-containing protein n=1 Tax=Mycolicibacterium iranicum TaxID=912594 RepID=A0ABT4HPV6_MYCIR|nr:hypothetical protein [Mycolicibacterium iranicum]MCZ0732218.1 hypothetical protein [Mycolicibacterium iranicum]